MNFVPIAVVAALSLCAVAPALAAKLNLNGQVTYRERIALPVPAMLKLQLIDETLPSAPPRVEVEAPIGTGQVPLSFSLGFDDTLIIPNHDYALIAAISSQDGLLFRNFEPYAVNPLAPAEPILIITSLVAETAPSTDPSSESAPPAAPAILDSTWVVTAIGDTPVLDRAVPTLSIGPDKRAGGSGGCNSWFAQAQLEGDTLRLGSITSTLKGCTQSVNLQEQAFKDALTATARWQIDGDTLTLFGTSGVALLHLKR